MDETLQIQVMQLASTTGTIAFAFSGFLLAARKNLDIMGIFILSFLTANGGGVIRDILVNRTPSILVNTEPFWISAMVTIVGLIFKMQLLKTIERKWFFVISDAIGLAAFSITGSIIAIEEEMHMFGFMTLSFLTATGGGIIRDVLAGNIPEVLHSDFYGSVAVLLSISMFSLYKLNMLNPLSITIVFFISIIIRLIAYKYNWKLPRPKNS